MRVTVNCSKCKGELVVKHACVTSLSNLILEVTPCTNIDCYDCSKCEEIPRLKEEVEKLKKAKTEKVEQRYKPKSSVPKVNPSQQVLVWWSVWKRLEAFYYRM